MSLSRYLAAALTAGLLLMAVAAEGQKSVADEVYSHAILNGHETDKKGLMDALLDMYAAKNLLSSAAAFEAYVGVLAKGYTVGSEEWNLRLEIFSDNLAFIAGHNSNEGASFSLGINEFSDWTASEFKSAFVTGMSHQVGEPKSRDCIFNWLVLVRSVDSNRECVSAVTGFCSAFLSLGNSTTPAPCYHCCVMEPIAR